MASQQASMRPDTGHRRTKSSVLKSFIHKRTLSKGTVPPAEGADALNGSSTFEDQLVLTPGYLHARALGELHGNQQNQVSSFPTARDDGRPHTTGGDERSLHKKTKSVISLKNLASKESDKLSKTKTSSSGKPKKTKSSTNLAALLSRPRSMKNLKTTATEDYMRTEKDKENRMPPRSSPAESVPYPPIYAQFSTQQFAVQPLGGSFLEDEIDLYTPQEYSPSKQRNFYEGPDSQPTLGWSGATKRPMSNFLPGSFSIQDISRHVGGLGRRSAEQSRRISFEDEHAPHKKATETKPNLTMAKRGAKVMAAVAAMGTKTKTVETDNERVPDIKNVDVEFEALLDRRNIPENQRHKMRSLAVAMKIDFIKQDWAETAAIQTSRPGTNGSDGSADEPLDSVEKAGKTKRPRSKTFTLSKSSKEGSSSTKNSRAEGTFGHSRTKSSESTISYAKSLTVSTGVGSTLLAKVKAQLPGDFVAYLRKVQKPELVEVGKQHKLRLLLRNETVAWTDEFIALGGMAEIIALLHRIMEVEWREEHEDALLHEVLLCLKALCTTALALQYLNEIQQTLFPALIHMLFDEEKKGPSEFTTRNIITSLLFTYLKSAPLSERCHRAQVLLSYLRDPEPKEEERPVGFVLEMRRERPFRVWCKEVVNVTKEVFWIFLHNLNVIALPQSSTADTNMKTGMAQQEDERGFSRSSVASSRTSSDTSSQAEYSYILKHFPQERPPVPAAPYVGGVEWDATNYLASHLDLINGILSCLPTKDQRNKLREQLQVSGWEKCMGGTLRICKEKFYGGVHAGLRCWVAAGLDDGWDVRDVRCGPPAGEGKTPTAKNSPVKKKLVEEAPKIEMPKLDFEFEKKKVEEGCEGWL